MDEDGRMEYGEECKMKVEEMLHKKGVMLSLEPEVAIIIWEAVDVPEDFYQDGELSHEEALENWRSQLYLTMNPTWLRQVEKVIWG